MEREALIFQLKAEIFPQEDPFIAALANHNFPEPLITNIQGYEFIIQKLYEQGCESVCPGMDALPPDATKKQIELYNLEKKMARTFTAVSLTNDKAAVQISIEFLKRLRSVEYAQLDGVNISNSPPSIGIPGTPWGVGQICAPEAWHISEGDNVVIGVVDSGVAYTHSGLDGNMWRNNAGEFGYDFSTCDNDPEPFDDHGTHCAGTIAAENRIHGVAPKAKIWAMKVYPGAYDSFCARAIKYAACNGAKVINNSWEPADPNPRNETLIEAVDCAYLKNCIVVFAAGNKNTDVKNYSPANYVRVISVAATNDFDNRWEDSPRAGSNYGDLVTIAAPGFWIESLTASGTGYASDTGTSMACAHVSGVVALILKANPNLCFEQVKQIIVENCDEITPDKPIGAGRINALKCVEAAEKILLFPAVSKKGCLYRLWEFIKSLITG